MKVEIASEGVAAPGSLCDVGVRLAGVAPVLGCEDPPHAATTNSRKSVRLISVTR